LHAGHRKQGLVLVGRNEGGAEPGGDHGLDVLRQRTEHNAESLSAPSLSAGALAYSSGGLAQALVRIADHPTAQPSGRGRSGCGGRPLPRLGAPRTPRPFPHLAFLRLPGTGADDRSPVQDAVPFPIFRSLACRHREGNRSSQGRWRKVCTRSFRSAARRQIRSGPPVISPTPASARPPSGS